MRHLLLLLLALPLSAQAPRRPRTITEFTLGTRIVRTDGDADPYVSDDPAMMMAIGLGRVTPIGARTSLGGIFSAGIQDGNGYLAIGPRLRYHATPATTLDFTPSIMVAHNDDLPGPLILDASVMHRDKIGLSIQATAGRRRRWLYDGPTKTSAASLAAGLRLGGKPGRIGGAIGIATVTAGVILILTSWSD